DPAWIGKPSTCIWSAKNAGGTVNVEDDLTTVGTDNAAFVSQSVPANMVAGQRYNVSVTLQNNGGTAWTAGAYSLGAQNPQDNTLWTGSARVALSAPVAPGGSATFNFTVTAPSTPGGYALQWRMVHEGAAWFGAVTPSLTVTVSPPPPPAPTLGV